MSRVVKYLGIAWLIGSSFYTYVSVCTAIGRWLGRVACQYDAMASSISFNGAGLSDDDVDVIVRGLRQYG